MPTGYTAVLYEGEQSVKDFILTCARAWGPTIMQRDEPLDVKPKYRRLDPHYAERLVEAEQRLVAAKEMTTEAATELSHEVYVMDMESWQAYKAVKDARKDRFKAMYAAIESNYNPEDEGFEKFKAFMIEQLNYELGPDFGSSPPVEMTGEAFRQSLVDKARRDIAYYTTQIAEETKRCMDQNAWIDALYRSVEGL